MEGTGAHVLREFNMADELFFIFFYFYFFIFFIMLFYQGGQRQPEAVDTLCQ